jgi:hypothetical protein
MALGHETRDFDISVRFLFINILFNFDNLYHITVSYVEN